MCTISIVVFLYFFSLRNNVPNIPSKWNSSQTDWKNPEASQAHRYVIYPASFLNMQGHCTDLKNKQKTSYLMLTQCLESRFVITSPPCPCLLIELITPGLISLSFPPGETLDPLLPIEHPSKTLVRLRILRWAYMSTCIFCWTPTQIKSFKRRFYWLLVCLWGWLSYAETIFSAND